MADILHDTYDILKKIGSGGSGVVYLAQHKRLNKLVVIKEDKRRISAAPEAVSREMNILKNLSHTYIPHLYDFLLDENLQEDFSFIFILFVIIIDIIALLIIKHEYKHDKPLGVVKKVDPQSGEELNE